MPESFHVLPVSAHWSAKISAHMIGIGGWLTVFIMAAVCHLGFLVVKRPILHHRTKFRKDR